MELSAYIRHTRLKGAPLIFEKIKGFYVHLIVQKIRYIMFLVWHVQVGEGQDLCNVRELELKNCFCKQIFIQIKFLEMKKMFTSKNLKYKILNCYKLTYCQVS